MALETVSPVLDRALYFHDLLHRRRERALADLVEHSHSLGLVTNPDRLILQLVRREHAYSSAIGKGVAVPHARSLMVREPHVVAARSRKGIDWKARDGMDVELVILVLAPADLAVDAFHDLVARAVGMTKRERQRQRLLEGDREALLHLWHDGGGGS